MIYVIVFTYCREDDIASEIASLSLDAAAEDLTNGATEAAEPVKQKKKVGPGQTVQWVHDRQYSVSRTDSTVGARQTVQLVQDRQYSGSRTDITMGRDDIPVRRPDSQSREPGFKSHCGRFEPLASLITPCCHSSLSCINEYLAIQTVVEM